jgi:hypothetical protein
MEMCHIVWVNLLGNHLACTPMAGMHAVYARLDWKVALSAYNITTKFFQFLIYGSTPPTLGMSLNYSELLTPVYQRPANRQTSRRK